MWTRRPLHSAHLQMCSSSTMPSKHHYASSQLPHEQCRHLPPMKLSHHQRRCLGSRQHFWTKPWKPEGKDSLAPKQHVQAGSSAVPRCILEIHRDVVFSMDIMFVNKIPFLVTSSCNIHFSTVESLPNCQVGTIATCLKKVTRLYHH